MTQIKQINVVLGYGCHLDVIVRAYLDHAATHIKRASPKTSLVITTGGHTAHRTAPGVSEAGLMAEHLRTLGVEAPILVEEAARTTVENLRNVAEIIRGKALTPDRVLIFCDRVRRHKIGALAHHFFGAQPFELEPHDLERTLFHTLVQSTVAVPFDVLTAKLPLLEKLSLFIVERRMRRA